MVGKPAQGLASIAPGAQGYDSLLRSKLFRPMTKKLPALLSPMSQVAENESVGRIRYNLLQRMYQPCGRAPERPEDM